MKLNRPQKSTQKQCKLRVGRQCSTISKNIMFREKDEKKIARVTEAFLKMKKFEIAKLQEATTQE